MSPPGRISSAIPANPMITPTMAIGLSRRPFAAKSNVAIQSGKVATINAATPVSIRCCATATSALPPTSRNVPTIAVATQWWRVGRSRGRKITKRIAPATRNRIEAIRNGGIDSIAISIPRYVAPQMT